MLKIYGIKNCDTMKKAFTWLEAAGVAYEFHDYKKSGIAGETLQRWEKTVGWETLLNRRGTTWRKLPESAQTSINRENALRLMQEQPALIKRPVVECGALIVCGFDAEHWQQTLPNQDSP